MTFPWGEGARKADEGLFLTFINLAALARFALEKLFVGRLAFFKLPALSG
ncbi:MAG: hypothetical protein ABFD21_07470 [Anaerolineaceae bacterium]